MHITTVLGPITPEELGITLGHEHLLLDLRGLWDDPPAERAHLINQGPTLENLGELLRNPYDSRPNLLLDDPELILIVVLSRSHAIPGASCAYCAYWKKVMAGR